MRGFILLPLICLPLLLTGAVHAQDLPRRGIPDEGDPGFRVEIQGVPEGMDRSAFVQAVLGALPDDLLDPSRNFTRSEVYQPEADYRLLMVFHAPGGEMPMIEQICTRVEGPPLPGAEPPEMENLTTTTRIAAAFCRGQETLSTANDQMTGEVTPDKASFRFLVADVAKQLFPGGFAQLPGTPIAPPTVPPG